MVSILLLDCEELVLVEIHKKKEITPPAGVHARVYGLILRKSIEDFLGLVILGYVYGGIS